ncbi:uncharacterized protein LOC123693527 [Colias croceus]|uniref:uncharacterized protein LOC123693527 n=1 Tax=Colias crocea TaxID=72248 RepID=UPI001E27E308|nr:uncharacterized protein LOC123693527 [Colias croceus]XP_045494636.1 uncharacterized protein LOC123693527 [Colias croceus]XP_045494637.1 uncharacterized protein LOC123693527 [Colias croceus]XP_045494638.1 uncharacterized protein LOC123693527 [Colias croceus]
MAFVTTKSQVPKDAVVMDETEAAEFAWDLVYSWKELSDVWALRYGSVLLAGINGISGAVINKHYRRKLKLGTYGHFSSVIPVTVMPAILTMLFHRYLISTDMILMKGDQCPICYEIRSAATQVVLGTTYPMLLAPTSALMMANRYNTYRVPELIKGPKVLFKFLRTITKPLTGTLTALATIQIIASSIVTYFEMKNSIVLRNKVMEIEQKLLAEQEQ